MECSAYEREIEKEREREREPERERERESERENDRGKQTDSQSYHKLVANLEPLRLSFHVSGLLYFI